jgi:multidrug efflux pump subunit AcrA (membrane-fusion protein)
LFEAGDASRSRLDEATRRFRSAQGALETARSDLETLQARQERGRILAPVSGLVLQVPVTLGAAVDRGELIAEVTADPPVLRLAAPERHADRLAEADEVQIETPGGLATARVVKVYPEIVQGRVEADIQLSEAMTTRFAGRRVGVRLTTGSRTSIVVPRRFLTRRHGLAYVYRETGGKTLVQTGHAWSDRVEVLSGLEPGDRLVLPSTTAAPT